MSSLRMKIAMLLAVAIVSVVGALTGVFIYVLGPPMLSMDPVAKQVDMLVRAVNAAPDALPLVQQPSPAPVSDQLTQRLRSALAARGTDHRVLVSDESHAEPPTVSIAIDGRGWLLMPISSRHPHPDGGPLRGLLKWLAVITLGALALSIIVANRMVKPLVMLEEAVEAVGTEGVLPYLPERGPGEVRATARAINSLSSRLKGAMESRMRLVAAAGHDLRTPITRMRLRAEFVEDVEERALWLRDIEELERIADSAIQLVREEAGKVPPEVLRLDTLVADVAGELKSHGYEVSIGTRDQVSISAGRLALARALRNLMINAATHGVRAHVDVGRNGSIALVTIADEGPGIPDHLLGQVFEPFFRADPARRQSTPGAGLGLTIAREIIQRAGGEVSIANGPSGGLRQVIKLPLETGTLDA